MNSLSRFQLPYIENPAPLVAAGLGANKGYWMVQLRDPKSGQFIEMGGGIHFLLKNKTGKYVYVQGSFEGSNGTSSKVKVGKNAHIPAGTYDVKNSSISQVEAILGEEFDPYLIEHGIDIEDVVDVSAEDRQNAQDIATLKPASDQNVAPSDTEMPAAWSKIKTGEAFPQSEDDSMFTEEQIAVMEWFSDAGYEEAQKYHVRGQEISDESKAKLKVLQELIDANSAETNQILYRGIATTNPKYAEQILAYKPGDIVNGRNFSSHSTDISRAEFYANMDLENVQTRVLFRTMTPKGSKGFRIPDWASSYGDSEKEVLFPPDTKYKVAKVSQGSDGMVLVDLEVVETPSLPKKEDNIDYKMAHKAPQPDDEDFHKPLHQIDQIFPKDVLDPAKQHKLYASGNPEADKEAFAVINAIKGNPDAEVTIYRGVPSDVDTINAGDWVTLSKKYAEGHIDSNVPGGKVISMKVKASELYTNADSIQEWGYAPAQPAPEPEAKPKPAIPTPAMLPKKKAPAPQKPKSLDFPSETKVKPEQKTVTALDGNSQPIKKGDKVYFELERDGKSFKVEGEYLGVSLGSLSGKDDANKPFIRIKRQDGIKDGDYPIRSDVLNLGPGDSNFRDTRTPLASKLEAENYVPDATRLTQLSKDEFDAVFAYTTENAFDDIRSLMEKHPGKTLDDIKKVATSKQDQETLQQIKLIEDAIYNSPLAEDTKLYRGIEFLDDADFELALKSLKVGEPIYDASIVSTSSDPAVAEKFTGGQGIIFEIDAPAGSPALETPWFYNDLSVLEDEYMLPRNSELEITEIGEMQDGIVRVKVKYRPPLTRQAQGIQTPQLTQPNYKTFNSDEPSFDSKGKISVPNSAEANDLATLGSPTPGNELKAIDDKTRELFTPDKDYKPFDPGLATSKQIESLNDLTPTGEAAFKYVDSSLKLNRLLRERDAATEVSDDVKRLDEAILISEHLPPGATVYRMMKTARWEELNVKPGQVIFDRGFMSTTLTNDYVDEILDENDVAKKVLQIPMKIVMPNNTSGISLRPISWFFNENEYLLPRNTALRFLGWDSDGFATFERLT